MNVKTHTNVTEGYPEVGPFESEEAAWTGALRPIDQPGASIATVLSVERRADGWYKVYAISTTTSTTMLCPGHGIVNPRRRGGHA